MATIGVLFGFLFIGIFCMSLYQNAKYKQPPFFYEISAIKEDFVWTFNKDSEIRPLYEKYREWVQNPETREKYPNEKLQSYEEYKENYTHKPWAKWHIIRTFLHPIWMAFLLFLFCLPRPRGIRINRKKTDYLCTNFKRHLPCGVCAEGR